jgi:tRNA uridine 5-carboxymethylaminomethyl modification enzyme
LRLTPIGYQLGLIDRARYEAVENKRDAIATQINRLKKKFITLDDQGVSALELLCRPEVNYQTLLDLGLPSVDEEIRDQVEIEVKYQGYIEKQQKEVQRMQGMESRCIPQDIAYETFSGLRYEARQKLSHFRPATLGQASRLDGVTPVDIAILLMHLEKGKKAPL